MDLNLTNKIAIVTGGSAGIGRGVVERLVKEGAKAAIFDISIDLAKKAADEIGEGTIAVKVDVTKKAEVDDAVKTVVDRFGQIDILVNNAALSWPQRFVDMEEKDWDRMCDVNLKGVYLVTRPVIAHMIERRYGKIISISSIAGKEGDCPVFTLFGNKICRDRPYTGPGA